MASFFASEKQRVVRILIRSMTQAGQSHHLLGANWLTSRSYGGCRLHQPVDRGRDAVRCAARLEVRVLSSSIELCKSDELAQAETPLRSPSNPPNSAQTRRPYVPRPHVPNRTPAIVCCRSSARSEQRARALFGATIGPSARLLGRVRMHVPDDRGTMLSATILRTDRDRGPARRGGNALLLRARLCGH